MLWSCIASTNNGSLVFPNDVIADRAVLSDKIHPNASDIIKQHFPAQMDNKAMKYEF